MALPILRPSESVSKSITSLGNIMEAEERVSVMLDDGANTKANRTVNDTIDDENINQINDNADIDIEAQAKINDTVNNQPKDGSGMINDLTDKYIGDDGKPYTKEQLIEKYGANRTDQIIEKYARIIQKDLGHLVANDDIYRPSTDSTFDHNVPTKTVAYEQKLDKILEEQATQVLDKILEDEATQVRLQDEISTVTSKKVEMLMSDKEINTSFSLVPRADKSTSVASQSLGDIAKRLHGVKADGMFSSLRIKPKVDYSK